MYRTPTIPRGRLRSDIWYDPNKDPPDPRWTPHFSKEEWQDHVQEADRLKQTELRDKIDQRHDSAEAKFHNRFQNPNELDQLATELQKDYALCSLWNDKITDVNDDDREKLSHVKGFVESVQKELSRLIKQLSETSQSGSENNSESDKREDEHHEDGNSTQDEEEEGGKRRPTPSRRSPWKPRA